MQGEKNIYKIISNGFEFSFSKDQIEALDFAKVADAAYNLLKDHKSVTAKIIESDNSGKKITVEIDGQEFPVVIKDELDQMLDKMGYGAASGKHIREIRAPMPGLVLDIAVKDGQEVNEGDKILILEAMKMENSITIQANARIKKINVSAGQAVEKGQVLVELE